VRSVRKIPPRSDPLSTLQKVSREMHEANRATSSPFCREAVILMNVQIKKGNKKRQIADAGNPPLSIREIL
jgi:hypothetical protein